MKITNLKDASSVSGGKASGLALLNKMGVPVPAGFVIDDTLNLEFNEANILEIQKFLSQLDSTKKLAVRSSARAEDGASKSFAGIFETELNVKNDINSVLDAIKKVNASATTDVVKAYANDEEQIMNIVIQEMVEPQIAGVMFSEAIDINGDDVVLFECVEGLADKLVSGSADPAQVIVKVKENQLDETGLRVEGSLLNLSNLKNIFPFVNRIKRLSDRPLDMEWCIDKDGKPYFVQARPITSTVFINKATKNDGIVASRGYAEGETYVIDENKSDEEIKYAIDNFPEGAILVAGVTETLYMPAIKKAKGIITEEGSALSHAAIVSRELGIPCIAGYKNAISLFPTGTKLVLDASNGKIIANGVEDSLNTKKGFEFGELYCFDNALKVDFSTFKAFFELTYGGLMLHMAGDDATSENMEQVEKYARKVFNTSPEQHFDDKYLWYFEIERFKKLPFYNEMNQKMMEIVEKKDSKMLDTFYNDCLGMLAELVNYKMNGANDSEKLIIDEIGAATNLILDAMLPLGYALRQCYFDSSDLCKKYNLSFNDLFVDNDLKTNDSTLMKIKDFLSSVAKNRNAVYEKICSIGATSPEYFELRDDEVIKTCGYNQNATIDSFYSSLTDSDFETIRLIMEPYVSEKKNSDSIVRRK
ncbi:MAG TPA: hypothetical protein DHV70_02610 [Firmicutes bacterium]|nr:hypothetical protein [Bacillota bacterium]